LLAVDPTNPPVAAAHPSGTTFPTTKSVDAVQACLTDKLSEVGEVAAAQPDRGTTILLIRGNPDGPMVVELTPQMVTVTTKLITGTRELIKGCV
jgi:hypothetical protein